MSLGRDRKTPLNFLIFLTDQQRADHAGFGGNPIVRTPNLDRLADTSVRFDRAYVANPICMPNRATIMTGRFPSAHGTRVSGIPLDWDANTFVRVLRRHGWQTSHVGKLHLQNMGYGMPTSAGDSGQTVEGEAALRGRPEGWDAYENVVRHTTSFVEIPADYYGFDHVDLVCGHSDFASGHYYQWAREQGVELDELRGAENAPKRYEGWNQVYQSNLPEELYPTSYVTMRAIEQLRASKASGQPFLLLCSYPDPHHPFTPPARFYEMYDSAEIPLPKSFGDLHEKSSPFVQTAVRRRGVEPSSALTWAPSEDQFRHAAAAEYGMITMIDEGVGAVLAELARLDFEAQTVVVFTSDHGEMFGDHGLMFKGHVHYQGCVRVPLLIRAPGLPPGGVKSLVGSIDLAPTILELAGCPLFHGIQGRSLVPVLEDPSASVREHVLVEEDHHAFDGDAPSQMRTVITHQARLTVVPQLAFGELFDLESDPGELHNLYGAPEGRELRADLVERLVAAMTEACDTGVTPTALV